MDASSGFPRLRSLDVRGLSTATVYVKGFGTDDGDYDPWLGQHRKLEFSHGWRSDVFGYEWPSGNGKKTGFWSAAFGSVLGIASRFHPAFSALNAGWGGSTGAVALSWLWSYKTAEKNAIDFAPNLADDIKGLNFEYERVQVVAHSLGCRLVIEAVSRLPREYLPSHAWLLAPACREDTLRGRVARERTWLYHTEKDWTLRYLFPVVSGGKALGAVGLRSSYPGLTAVDVSDRFDFWVHEEYKNRFANWVGREEIFPALGQQTKVFLPARERFERRTENRSNAPRAADGWAAQQVRPAARKETTKRAEQGAPLPLTREWLEAQKRGSRKPIEKPAAANTEQMAKTRAADTGYEAAKRARDRLSERQAAQDRRPVKERKQVAVPRAGAKQDREEARKAPKKKSSRWGWRLALSAAALALGIPYIG